MSKYLWNIIKKTNPNLHALRRVKCYIGLEQNKLIMPSFIKSQFSCCPVIWMFCSRASMSKLSNIHEKCLRLITNNYDSNFNGLLESSHEFKIHKTYINYLMIEVYKYLLGLSPELMTDIFKSLQHLQYFVYLYFAIAFRASL